jgi:hypothetical protein
MRTKTQFRAVKEVDDQLAWQKKVIREESKDGGKISPPRA